jgi:hypothetical protein
MKINADSFGIVCDFYRKSNILKKFCAVLRSTLPDNKAGGWLSRSPERGIREITVWPQQQLLLLLQPKLDRLQQQ